jgi:hypothetical protein
MTYPVIPSPRAWQPGDLVNVPTLRGDIADTVALLTAPPAFAGAQTISSQPISMGGIGSAQGVILDTELLDNWQMHQDSSAHPDRCYPPLPGLYLAQAYTPLAATSGGGITQACIRAVSGGGTQADYGGATIANNATYSAGPIAARLVRMSSVGAYGTGDYCAPSVGQTSSGPVGTYVGPAKHPLFTLRWIAALTGYPGLPAPALPAVPSPITSAWLNSNSQAIWFLVYPPAGDWYLTSAIAPNLPSATVLPLAGTTIGLDTTANDTTAPSSLNPAAVSAMNLAADTFTAPVPGRYWTYGLLAITGAATTLALAAGLTVTSANYNSGTTTTLWGGVQAASGTTATQAAAARRMLRLNAGDTLQLAGWQRDSSSFSASVLGGTNNNQSRLIVIWAGL